MRFLGDNMTIVRKEQLPRPVTFFFLDGTTINLQDERIRCYGGFYHTIPPEELGKIIIETKTKKLGLEEWMPVKWNFEGLRKYYQKHWLIPSYNFDARFNEIKKRSWEIRKYLLLECAKGLKIRISIFSERQYQKEDEVCKWLIKNLFQRIGLDMDPRAINLIVCDYEDSKSMIGNILTNTYFEAYHKGEGYFSGPLKRRGAFPDIAFSSTYRNHFLQISDIIVGCIGAIVKTWKNQQIPQKHAKEIFKIMKDCFVKNPKTNEVFRYGIVSSKDFYSYLQNNNLI